MEGRRRGWAGGSEGEGEGGGEGGGDAASVWKVPRPPPLNVVDRSPAMVMNSYSMQARFQVKYLYSHSIFFFRV